MKLVKMFLLLAMVLTMTSGVALPALAGSTGYQPESAAAFEQAQPKHEPDKGPVIVFRGVLTGKSGNIITVQTMSITVSEATKYNIQGVKNGTLADLKVGMRVGVQTRQEAGIFVAFHVVARLAIERQPGKITAYANDPATGGSVTIEAKDGKTFTFTILPGKFNIRPAGAIPKVGDNVTVFYTRDGNNLVATGMTIHYPPLKVTGTITAIDKTAKTITVGTTMLKYGPKTTFVLRGILAVEVGQYATALYRPQPDGSNLAGRMQVTETPPPPAPTPTPAGS
ncbi:MAG: hypothetical protein HYY29_00220 [Chloroflexi bacterium]|nr:hypothetical protein [Chloroflexota bacterium]